MNVLEQKWLEKLNCRKKENTYRSLKQISFGADFMSNDYLGLARSSQFGEMVLRQVAGHPKSLLGSTGSRLISGNTSLTEEVERFIADEHRVGSALFFASGYNANIALFSCVLSRFDTVIVDERVHRSTHDGCRLSPAKKWKFRHNDLNHLENLLKKAKGNKVVAIESIYSVDGDFAPLTEILKLTKQYTAELIVDEAHAIGVFGKGLVYEHALQKEVIATVVTYGKAMGLQGAAILGSPVLKQYLINYAAPFIYSTAPSALQMLNVKAAYLYIEKHKDLALMLYKQVDFFRGFKVHKGSEKGSPIQVICLDNPQELLNLYQELKNMSIQTCPLFAPTVPKGQERLRICIHAFNTDQEIASLCYTTRQYAYVT